MKKILSLMICMISIISLCSLAFSASAAPAGIAINNAEEFMAMVSTPVDAEGITARYYLMSDITLTGTYAEPFWGILDGNGKTITVTNPIFADFSGEVKNLTIKGDIYYTDADAAAFAVTSSRGYVATKVTNNANVTVFGHGKHVGGFSARIVNNTTLGVPAKCWFIDCVNNGRIYIDSIADEKMRAGGFAGIIDTCSFSNCINNGDVYAKGNICIAGGLVARVALSKGANVAEAFNCVNNGNVKVEDTYIAKDGTVGGGTGGADAGGIFGHIGTSGNIGWYRIWGCINNGNIDAPYRVGGISGYAYSSGSSQYIDVQFCINTGDIIYGRLSDVKEGTICYDYASPFVAYANSPFTTIKYCIDTGSLVKRENAISANDGQVFIGLSSADGSMYDIRGVYVLNKEQYKWMTWAYDDKNAANRHSIEEAEGIIVTTREDIRSGKVAYLINTEAKDDPYGWAGDDTDQPYFFYQTIGVDHFPTSDFTHGIVISNNGGYSNLNPADCEHTTTRRVYENILPATCTVPGSQDEVVYCLACSKELLRRACEIPASHNYEGKVIKPTVFAGGSTLYTCSVCFDSYSADFVPPLAPVPGDINGDGTATILDAIYMYLYLSGEDVECVASTLDANGDKVIDEKDAKAIAKSTVGDVAVSMGNICEHNLQFVPSASVTADKHGYSVDHWACTICKMCFTDETAKCAVAQDSVTIHLNEWVTEIPSTKTTDGSEKRVCSICGKILERRILHATGSEGLVFELSSDGTYYSLVGTGTCTDTDLYIPSHYNGLPVTTIPEWASISNDIVSLHIPATITTIEYDGWDQNLNAVYITDLFAWCNINFRSSWSTPLHTANNLYINGELVTTLLIPEGVKYIKFAAFAGCENITTVVLPESVCEIEGYAFESCSALTSVYIPKNVVYISSSALRNAEALTSINIAPDNQYYYFQNGCLIEKNTKTLVWGNHNSIIPADGSVTEIASNAFYACTKLTEITIPGTVKRIGYDAFSECSNLVSLTIGDGVETIGAWAFCWCTGLRNVTIPDSVTKIEDHVFYNCGNIDNFTFDGSPTKWEAVQKGKWWNAYSDFTVVCTKAEDGHRHVISEWITDKVAGKLENGLRHQECVICKEVMNTEVVPATGSVGLEFKLSEDGEQYILVGLGTCTDAEIGIPSVYNNKPVTIIARNAFNSDVVTSVLIPASITCIENYAFDNCKNLVAVHISDLKAWCNVDFYSYLANPLYFANNLYLNGELVTELVIPDGVTSLDRTFAGCKNITSVVCPESLIYLGYHTFMDCSKLTSVYISKNVSYIEGAAFMRCELLENINIDPANTYFCFKDGCLISIDEKSLIWGNHNSIIPSDGSVTRIGSTAFGDCTKLTSIIIPDSVEIIDYNAFSGCSNLENVIIGSGVKGICSSAFASCSSLGKIVLPAGLEIIEDWVFVDCTSLTSVTIPNSVKSIGWYTFDNCGKLTTVIFDGTATEWGAVTKADDWYGNCDFEVVFTKGEDGHTHDIIVIEAVNPSCTTTGLTEGTKCSICGYVLVAQEVLDALGHTEGEWVVDKAPTKTEEGSKHTNCTVCGAEFKAYIQPIASEGLVYTINEDGQSYTLSGMGTCTDTNVVIAGEYEGLPVTTVAEDVFNNYTTLESLYIPASITSFEWSGFWNCPNFTKVMISDLTAWCGIAFGINPLECAENLYLNGELVTNLVIPEGVTRIGYSAFSGARIESVVLPESLEAIGGFAFSQCYNLKEIAIPKNVYEIGGAAFFYCPIDTISVDPDNKTFKVVNNCLINTDNKTLICGYGDCVIPNDGSIARIANRAFAGNENLTQMVIPEGVTHLDMYAFLGCSNLTTVIVPNSIKTISYGTFSWCENIKTFIFDGFEAEWNNVSKYSDWNANCTFTVQFMVAADGHRHDQTKVEGKAPACTESGLTEGLKCSICGLIFREQNEVPATGHTEGEWVVDKAPTKTEEGSKHTNCTVCGAEFKAYIQPIASEGLVYTLTEDGKSYTLSGMGTCTDTNIVIAGEYEGLPVTIVGENVFNGYTAIESLYIPAGIIEFQWNDLWGCQNFTKVMISDLAAWCDIRCNIPLLQIARNLYLNGELVTDLVIPEGVKIISYSVFAGANINSVVLPESLERIFNSAFEGCLNLKEVTIPKNVCMISSYVFSGSGIEKITVDPANTTFAVVNNCLINVKDKSVLFGYGNCAIPNDGSVTQIAESAFANNSTITEMIIPEGITTIGWGAFGNCINLKNVSIPTSMEIIDSYAFQDCINITMFIYDGDEAQWKAVNKGGSWNFNTKFTVQFMVAEDGHKHDQTKVEGKAPTCTESGLTEGLKCSVCGLIFREQNEVPSTGHTEGEWVVDKAPTNTEDGVKKSTCTVCGAEFTASIPWLGSEGLELVLSDDGKYYILTGPGTCTDTEVYIPSVYNDIPVTTIAESAFFPSTVVALHIPASISSIGNMGIVIRMEDVYIYDLAAWCNISCNMASYSSGYNLYLNGQLVTDLVIPEGVKRINNYAFMKCASIKSVTIPKSLEHISGSVLSGWISLETVNVDAVKDRYDFIDGCLIDKENKKLIWGNANAVIPTDGSVTCIGDSAFKERTSLRSVTIPNGVTIIGWSALNMCDDLTTVIIPNSVTNIGPWAFAWSTNLTNIIFDGTSAEWEAITKGENWNSGCNFTVSFTVGEDGHTHDVTAIEAVKPTCTATGLTEGLKCSACGFVFVKQATVNATGHSLGNGVCEICGIVLVIPEEYVDATPGYITTEDTVITTTHLMFEVPKNVYVMDNFVENVNLVTKIMERVSGMKFEGNPKYCDRTGNKTHAKVTVVKPEGSECGPAYALVDGGAVISACDIVDFYALIHENSHVLQYRQSGWFFCTWAMESISTYTTYKTVKYILENYPELILITGTPRHSMMNHGISDYGKLYEHTMEYWMENTFEYGGNNNYSIGFHFAWFLDEVYGDYTKWIYVYEESRPYHSADAANSLPVEEQAKAFKMAYGENVFDEFYAWLKQNEDKFDVSSVTDLRAEDQINLYPQFMADEIYIIPEALMYKDLCIDLTGGMYYLETYQNKNIDSLVLWINTQSPSSLLLFDAEGKCIRSENIDSQTEIDISGVYYIILPGTGVLNWFEIIGF